MASQLPESGEVMQPGFLGPSTEARFAAAFAHKAILSSSEAADLIGVDPKTLPSLPIRSVPRGAHRGYTERHLRAYLTEDHDEECATTAPAPKARTTAARPNVRLVNFSERRRKR
jgi:hypothetical protein